MASTLCRTLTCHVFANSGHETNRQKLYQQKCFALYSSKTRFLSDLYSFPNAGFYICWGCLVWVPSIYPSPGMYLVNLGTQLALFILAAGLLCYICQLRL